MPGRVPAEHEKSSELLPDIFATLYVRRGIFRTKERSTKVKPQTAKVTGGVAACEGRITDAVGFCMFRRPG